MLSRERKIEYAVGVALLNWKFALGESSAESPGELLGRRNIRRELSELAEEVLAEARQIERVRDRALLDRFVLQANGLTDEGRFANYGAEGRIEAAFLQPQPDDTVPRFDYENHLAALTGPSPHWPPAPPATTGCRPGARAGPGQREPR